MPDFEPWNSTQASGAALAGSAKIAARHSAIMPAHFRWPGVRRLVLADFDERVRQAAQRRMPETLSLRRWPT